MTRQRRQLSTGLPQLDRVFRGIMPGDNIVWQVDSVDDYLPFVRAYAAYARETRQRLIYFRFADHPPLLLADADAQVCELHPEQGFETFITEIHTVISREGRGTLFLFDCLSQLAPDWKSDRMLGNFFLLICPHLYDRAAIAYFAIFRNYHSFHAVKPIANTTQILVDVYRRDQASFIHPLKVQYRHSATMYMLHERQGDAFVPVTQSAVITAVRAAAPWSRAAAASLRLGFWSRTFAEAQAVQDELDRGRPVESQANAYFQQLLRMLISHEPNVLKLAETYLTLRDLLTIRRRMIGTGFIGGKAVGMLLARAILEHSDGRWRQRLEPHDSFYVGADVFYTYLVQNGCWWMMQKYRQGQQLDDDVETVRRRILAGDLPDYIVAQFADMLEYFGQSPIIVRSSSLLEDNFGNAFAGKYESVFCANQGGQDKRLEDFLCAVRTVYASTLSEAALQYRAQRNLLRHEEQMGLLIQRVSGTTCGHLFFPQAAGVGFSFNPYVWNERIDPHAGVLRLVFGLGTRAVDRSDDDYTRIVSLNAPFCRPEASLEEVREHAQRRVDVLDLEANQLTSCPFDHVVDCCGDQFPLAVFASRDTALERRFRHTPFAGTASWMLSFEHLLKQTPFVSDMQEMLRTLQTAYSHPVDLEFTLNFFSSENYQINVVQCRPLQVQGQGEALPSPERTAAEDLLLQARGAVIGRSLQARLDWVIYVTPQGYNRLPERERYEVARIIADITRHEALQEGVVMLVGPGRWGTTTPSLGIPVAAADIAPVAILCELVMMRDTLIPDVSFGTHFFSEMVENDMLYLALFPGRPGNDLNQDFFERGLPNRLQELLPESANWGDVVKVLCARDLDEDSDLLCYANPVKQEGVCWRCRLANPRQDPAG